MKKLVLLATILTAVALLFFGINKVSAQPIWASYSDLLHSTPSDNFTELNCTVYMYGTGFTKNADYKVIYWDGDGYKRVTEVQRAGPDLVLESQHTFDLPDVVGEWH